MLFFFFKFTVVVVLAGENARMQVRLWLGRKKQLR